MRQGRLRGYTGAILHTEEYEVIEKRNAMDVRAAAATAVGKTRVNIVPQ